MSRENVLEAVRRLLLRPTAAKRPRGARERLEAKAIHVAADGNKSNGSLIELETFLSWENS